VSTRRAAATIRGSGREETAPAVTLGPKPFGLL
jgi:hypothetical protein